MNTLSQTGILDLKTKEWITWCIVSPDGFFVGPVGEFKHKDPTANAWRFKSHEDASFWCQGENKIAQLSVKLVDLSPPADTEAIIREREKKEDLQQIERLKRKHGL